MAGIVVLLLRMLSNEDCVASALCEHLLVGIARGIDHDGWEIHACGTAKRMGGMHEAATDSRQWFSTGLDEHGHPFRRKLALHFLVN